MNKRILLLGCDGQVGRELQRTLSPLGTVLALNRTQCDLTQIQALRSLIASEQPEVIVNAAAYTAVDRAESEHELAHTINAEAPTVLAEAAKRIGALLVHYSTDYVFDGRKSTPYVESDPTHPLSVYGKTKRAGEEGILASGNRALIFRTSWVFGEEGHNFVKTVLRLAGEGRTLRIVDDQHGSPTPASLIADVTGQILAATRRGDSVSDARLYHLTSSSPVSWCGFAREILRQAAGLPGFESLPSPEQVRPIHTADYPLPAPRPINSRLDCGLLERDFALHMPDWRPALAQMLKRLAHKG